MDAFVAKHADAIRGVLSCFDRVLLRGYLPLMSGDAMADFLKRKQVKRRTLKAFLLTQADRVKKHALSMAAAAKRPHQYLSGPTRKEDLARQIAERDGITEGLICVFSGLEPCRTFVVGGAGCRGRRRVGPRQVAVQHSLWLRNQSQLTAIRPFSAPQPPYVPAGSRRTWTSPICSISRWCPR